jgi:hypothetical protein
LTIRADPADRRRVTTITVINESERTVNADVTDGRVSLTPQDLHDAIGWELKPQGLCRDSVCVPFRSRGASVELDAAAAALGRAVVVDGEAGVVALALPAEERRRAVDARSAPPFSLPDLDGTVHDLGEWRGRKKLLVAFSTW